MAVKCSMIIYLDGPHSVTQQLVLVCTNASLRTLCRNRMLSMHDTHSCLLSLAASKMSSKIHFCTRVSYYWQTNWKFDVTERNMKSKFALRKEYRPTLPKFCFSASAYQTVLTDSSSFCEDISKLPPPRHTLMTRELPYVYRYKIQQGITSLSNMIPSRRSHTTSNIW